MIYPKPFQEKFVETVSNTSKTERETFFGKRAYLYLPDRFFCGGKARLMCELFKNFTGGTGILKIVRKNFAENCAFLSFTPCENAEREVCGEKIDCKGYSYALKISERGVAMSFADETEAEHAFFTLWQTIEIRSLRETVVNNSENRAERKSGGKKRKGRKHPHKGNEAQNLSVAPRKTA